MSTIIKPSIVATASLKWVKVSKTFLDFSDALKTKNISIYDLPGRQVIHCCVVEIIENFGGNGETTATTSVGNIGNLTKYFGNTDVFGASTSPQPSVIVGYESLLSSGNKSIEANLTVTTNPLKKLSKGSVNYFLLVSDLP